MSTPNTDKVKLWLLFGSVARLALSIPLAECNNFAIHPLKWLRFLGFAICGQEGYLRIDSKTGPEINDYDADIEARAYVFVPAGEARLVDVDAADDRTSNASSLSTRRRDFRSDVIERDGTCVMTNDKDEICDACHILPHAKGSTYILNLVNYRGGTYGSAADDLEDIDDTRNGLLLNTIFHRPFEAGKLAFLKTPNFAMSVDDVPFNRPEEADEEEEGSTRLTLQYFVDPSQLSTFLTMVPHNSDARQPQDTREWPPAIIVDLFYASVALNAWSSKSFINYVRARSKDVYYDEADDQFEDDDQPRSRRYHLRSRGKKSTSQLKESEPGSYHLRGGHKTSAAQPKESRPNDLMLGVCALWKQTSSRVGKPKPEGVRASDLSRNKGVEKWLHSIK